MKLHKVESEYFKWSTITSDSNDKYYPLRLCSSNSLLNPSFITSSTSIAQKIIKQDSKLFAYSFAFWKSLPSAHLTTILRLWRFNLSYRGKNNKKGSVKYSIHCCFPTYLKLLFSLAGNRRMRIPAVTRTKKKMYKTCSDKIPLYWQVGF